MAAIALWKLRIGEFARKLADGAKYAREQSDQGSRAVAGQMCCDAHHDPMNGECE